MIKRIVEPGGIAPAPEPIKKLPAKIAPCPVVGIVFLDQHAVVIVTPATITAFGGKIDFAALHVSGKGCLFVIVSHVIQGDLLPVNDGKKRGICLAADPACGETE